MPHPTGLPMPSTPQPTQPALPNRLSSLDAFRGFVMFLMMAEVLHIAHVAKSEPYRDSEVWQTLAFHTSHVEWSGCSLHDLIQPSFSFLVGAALPFSLVSRRQKGQSFGWMRLHAAWRAALLVGLGVFLRSTHTAQTRFTFEDTLSQIGLGYFFLFLLGFARPWGQWLALVVILVGYWLAFWMYPAPGPDYDYQAAGVDEHFLEAHPPYTGLAAHWNKNSNLAYEFDNRYVRRIPEVLNHGEPFKPNRGGYATLSFIPTLGTMILGLIAGGWLKNEWSHGRKIACLVGVGALSLLAGLLLDHFGICPSVKRIWTPSWVLVSGGWCLFFTAGFYALADGLGLRPLFFPLIVIGMNSIAIYFLVHIELHGFIQRSFRTHFGEKVFAHWGDPLQPFIAGVATLAVDWLILYWMYRNKVFVRI
jgi:heparan-alpha-glucosaminide N-acetyltransferase